MKRGIVAALLFLSTPAIAEPLPAPLPPLLGYDWMDPQTPLDQRVDPSPQPRADQRGAGLDDMVAGTRLLHDAGRGFGARVGRRLDRIDGGYLVIPVFKLKI